VVIILPTAHKTLLVEFVKRSDEGEAIGSQVHRNLTQTQTRGMLTQDIKD
jgi:hypothetical protein